MSETITPHYEPADTADAVTRALQLPKQGVVQVLALLAEGNTVPFIARYRKEATGGLDEVQIREVQEHAQYHETLEARRASILQSVHEQGKLTAQLRAQILKAETKTLLEDLYLPFKPKRRTKATIARERGLEPLAALILEQPTAGQPEEAARRYVDPQREVADIQAALSGARHIVAEVVAETVEVRALCREQMFNHGQLVAEATPEAKAQRTRFEQYYDFREPLARIPSHRYLALRRGEREEALRVQIELEAEPVLRGIERLQRLQARSPFAGQLSEAIADAWKRLLAPSLETELRVEVKLRSDQEAVEVFAKNLRDLLLASPLGGQPLVAIDPGFRTGCKCVALDATGQLLDHITIYPGQGAARDAQAQTQLLALLRTHGGQFIAIGNGTGGRETQAWVAALFAERPELKRPIVSVNEAGASIYSASDIAREEFPDLDLTLRGAISIGRRLQDPLAELVKIDPKSIGVGQYQHDVHQPTLARKLDEVVEDCVNQVGVALNTASAPLLARVAGIGPRLAQNIVTHRDEHGAFPSRKSLLKVKGLGPRTFEQCAGFLRIRGGQDPLDASAVHPERYALVAQMARDLGQPVQALVGETALVDRIDARRYLSDAVGEPTLLDILSELKKPGLDPREAFELPKFREDVHSISDLEVGMWLEGVVTNVTAFGAFVDIGVHQDGLVHISQLSERFVRDASEVVHAGQRLRVCVLSVDLERKRISLSARGPADERPAPREERQPPREARAERRPARREGGARPDHQRSRGGSGGDRPKGRAPEKAGFKHNPFAHLLKDR